jgi:predicted amidohydrolase
MTQYTQFKLAAIQADPVYFDREASTEKACRLIQEAGTRGATLAAFGETWLPGYPFFIWSSETGSLAAEYLANAVEIPSASTSALCEAARHANIDVVIGVAERDAQTQGTVYCTLLFIGSDGTILGRHRKLKPTHMERTAWGEGDGSGLAVYERPYAKISGLNCWEHNMVLPGYVLMSQGTQIHIAAWPGLGNSRHMLLSRAFASQASAYVIDVGAILSTEIVFEKYKDLASIVSDRSKAMFSIFAGESCIIDPRGEIIAGPAKGETILMADCSMEQIFAAKVMNDVAGHYSRPDVFQLLVNRTPHRRVVEMQGQEYEAVDSEMEPEK